MTKILFTQLMDHRTYPTMGRPPVKKLTNSNENSCPSDTIAPDVGTLQDLSFPTGISDNTVSAELAELLNASVPDSTRRALKSDLQIYAHWATEAGLIEIYPAYPGDVAEFIASMKETRSVNTISRYMSSLSKLHNLQSWPNPIRSELVRSAMRGLNRTETRGIRQAKALRPAELLACIDALSHHSWAGHRNQAILALGWLGALRASEIVALDVSDLSFRSEGLVVHIHRSKTSQDKTVSIGIPSIHNDITHIITGWWTRIMGLYKGTGTQGALFPRLGATTMQKFFPWANGSFEGDRMSVRSLSRLLKHIFRLANLGPGYSAHSLRRGMITTAAELGVPEHLIQRHSRHHSVSTLRGYIDEGNILVENPLPAIVDRFFMSGQNPLSVQK
jgi:integrase